MSGKEIEFKFRVADEAALQAFAQALGLNPENLTPKRQQNHFFDSEDEALRSNGLALRLRIENGHGILTIKGKAVARSEDGALSERFEAETTIGMQEAEAILSGERSPLGSLELADDPVVREGLARIGSALAGRQLVSLGGFANERTTLPPVGLDLGSSRESIVFELDRTSFPHGRIDCEIEAEIGPEADARALHAHLVALLGEAGIPWSTAPSKLARFLEILEADR